MYLETKARTILKTLSWRFCATIATIILVFIFTKRIGIAATVGGLEVVVKLILYYFHERTWNKIHKGKQPISPFVLWFTGLSGSGKSTLAEIMYSHLKNKGLRVERLDGDVVRSFFPKTGFTKDERNEHIKRIGFVASLLEKNGVFVVASFVSPYQEARDFVRAHCKNYIEVFVDTPIEECEKRDIKGLYEKARKGEINNFTGISDPYERPEKPEILIKTEHHSPEESADLIIKNITKYI